jgi:small-conductance mechanosensitive channel
MEWAKIAANPSIRRAVAALIGIVIVWLLARTASHYVMRRVSNTELRYRVRKSIAFSAYLVAAFIVAVAFSQRLAGLGVAFGVVGAGIAFALQEVIASVAGWVAISLGNFYATGDRVQAGGIRGDVIDIGILRTTLMELGDWVDSDLYNGRIVRIANSAVFKEPVYNYSADFPFLWDEIKLPVRYGSDWKLASSVLKSVVLEVCQDYATASREAWKKTVQHYRLEDAQIEPLVTLSATDNWIEFTVRYIVDYRRRRTTKHLLFTRVLEEVDRSENRIRLASSTFELTNLPRVDVRLRDGVGEIVPRFAP